MREHYVGQLTRSQRNNLLIQQQIGAMQAGESGFYLPALMHLPCSFRLYAKLGLYGIASLFRFRLTWHRDR